MSIFSRLKKPATAEPGSMAPLGEGVSHPAASANDEAERRGPSPAPKPNGVQPPAPKSAPPPVRLTKPNGAAESKPALAAPPSNGVAKRPELSKTMAYGAGASPRPPVPPPSPSAVPSPVQEPVKGSVELAIEAALAEPPAGITHGTSTAADQEAVRATFEDLAVPYVAELRGAMMEVQWGEAQASWLEMARPVLRALRKMAEPVGHVPLLEALDGFDAALAEVLAPGQPSRPSPAAREALLAAYAPLRACLPRAFELDGERDRREPLIVRALLEQVPGLDPLSIDKLIATGFGRLSALYAGRADEIAAVTAIEHRVAEAIVARVQAFRRVTPAGLAAVDTAAALQELARLVGTLRAQHAAFEAASRSWSEADRAAKRSLRRDRQHSLLQITIELVRLGEIDLVQRLDKLPFSKKIDEVDALIGRSDLSRGGRPTWVS